MLDRKSTLTGLRKLFASLYPTESDQRRLAREAGLNSGVIAIGGAPYNSWHAILEYARLNGGTERLLAIALDEYPGNESLIAYAEGRPVDVEGPKFEWCGPRDPKPLLEKAIFGRPSLVDVSHLALGLERARAVAKVVRGDAATGTGFLIRGDRLVTNHHVLPTVEQAAGAHVIFNYQKALGGHQEETEVCRLDPETCFETSAEDDWTVVHVTGNPVSRWGELPLDGQAVKRGDPVNIIQHPGGGPKQVALSFDVVAYAGAERVQYLTQTLPGSSGAPVFDERWNVVALHHSGGWIPEPGTGDRRVYYRNQGIALSAILRGISSGV